MCSSHASLNLTRPCDTSQWRDHIIGPIARITEATLSNRTVLIAVDTSKPRCSAACTSIAGPSLPRRNKLPRQPNSSRSPGDQTRKMNIDIRLTNRTAVKQNHRDLTPTPNSNPGSHRPIGNGAFLKLYQHLLITRHLHEPPLPLMNRLCSGACLASRG
jgi:hypothetical protein